MSKLYKARKFLCGFGYADLLMVVILAHTVYRTEWTLQSFVTALTLFIGGAYIMLVIDSRIRKNDKEKKVDGNEKSEEDDSCANLPVW